MIRRRSCVNTVCYHINISQKFTDLRQKKIFRNSVKFKKFHFRGTKFKRRHIRKLRHNATWPLQYNVFKYWTDDIRLSKQYARFQYYHRVFSNNSTFMFGDTWFARRRHLFLTSDVLVASSMTKKLYSAAKLFNVREKLNFQLNNHVTSAFYLPETVEDESAKFLFLSSYDDQAFPYNYEKDIKTFDIFQNNFLFDTLAINQLTEFYTILVILWYLQILK